MFSNLNVKNRDCLNVSSLARNDFGLLTIVPVPVIVAAFSILEFWQRHFSVSVNRLLGHDHQVLLGWLSDGSGKVNLANVAPVIFQVEAVQVWEGWGNASQERSSRSDVVRLPEVKNLKIRKRFAGLPQCEGAHVGQLLTPVQQKMFYFPCFFNGNDIDYICCR